MIFLARGRYTVACRTLDGEGNTLSSKPAHFEFDESGGNIAIGELDPDTMTQKGSAELFGDWDLAGIIQHILSKLGTPRGGNVPDFKEILRCAAQDRNDDLFCQYCDRGDCPNCIVYEWRCDLQKSSSERTLRKEPAE